MPSAGGRRLGEGVGQLVVAVEAAVGDHQRQVALAARQRQARRRSSSSTIHIPARPCQTLRRGAVEAVVVVPLEGGAFGPAVLHQVVDVGLPPPGLDQQVVARLARREAARDVGSRRSAGGTGSGRRAGRRTGCGCGRRAGGRVSSPAAAGSSWWKVTLVRCAGRAADRRAGEGAAVGPHPRLAARAGPGPRPRGSGSSDASRSSTARDRQAAPGRAPRRRRRGDASPTGQQRRGRGAQRQQPWQARRRPGRRGKLGAPGGADLRSFQPCC